ncbi:hypothetical protein KC367_g230 [Hortaea werneckii]|nr:hypothetical protein KC367_g230 [Hortaea werneckii]
MPPAVASSSTAGCFGVKPSCRRLSFAFATIFTDFIPYLDDHNLGSPSRTELRMSMLTYHIRGNIIPSPVELGRGVDHRHWSDKQYLALTAPNMLVPASDCNDNSIVHQSAYFGHKSTLIDITSLRKTDPGRRHPARRL